MHSLRVISFVVGVSPLLAAADIQPESRGIYRCTDTYISGRDYIENPRPGCIDLKTKERLVYPLSATGKIEAGTVEPKPRAPSEVAGQTAPTVPFDRDSSSGSPSNDKANLMIAGFLAIVVSMPIVMWVKAKGENSKSPRGISTWVGYGFALLSIITLLLAFYVVLGWPMGIVRASFNIGGAAIGDLIVKIIGTFMPAIALGAVAFRLLAERPENRDGAHQMTVK